MTPSPIFFEACGWLGMVLILLAYYLVTTQKVTAQSRNYQLINLFGAIALGTNVLYRQAWPAVALEVIWGTIAIIALLKIKKA